MKLSEKDKKRFFKYVKVNPETGCHEWQAYKCPRGYGDFSLKSIPYRAHRIAWEIANNKEIPEGMCICHKCDNRGCVNPEHLFLGTQKDNMEDMMKKKRHRFSNYPKLYKFPMRKRAKLTETQVLEILKLDIPQKEIMEIYGVSQQTVSAIKTRVRWKKLIAEYEHGK